jgi:hypothetical protein
MVDSSGASSVKRVRPNEIHIQGGKRSARRARPRQGRRPTFPSPTNHAERSRRRPELNARNPPKPFT